LGMIPKLLTDARETSRKGPLPDWLKPLLI
jgi:hypothetical protein